MKISEQHANGAQLAVSGWGARRFVKQWRKDQDALTTFTVEEEPEEEPKVKGTETHVSEPRPRSFEYGEDSPWTDMPVVFGFVPNEQNWR